MQPLYTSKVPLTCCLPPSLSVYLHLPAVLPALSPTRLNLWCYWPPLVALCVHMLMHIYTAQALGERGSAPRSVTISVCEIYNETINDLLHVAAAAGPAAAALHGGGGGGVSNRPPAGGLRLKEDKDGRMSVQVCAHVYAVVGPGALRMRACVFVCTRRPGVWQVDVNEHS